ncbi:MAG: hypothetical protein ACYSSO_07630 [Planctomycetota bacterium]
MELKKQNNTDFKYLALGLIIGICLMMVIGAVSDGRGRYQACSAGNNDQAVFVIDTQTGQTWRVGRTDTLDFGTPQQRKSERRHQTPITR